MKREVNTQFFTFDQNNSGGRYHHTKDLAQLVIIEAITAEEANNKAERLGIYFDGVDGGSDCQSCGDRWNRCYEGDGTDKPMFYADVVDENYTPKYGWLCDEGKPYGYIHYYDGTKTTITGEKK